MRPGMPHYECHCNNIAGIIANLGVDYESAVEAYLTIVQATAPEQSAFDESRDSASFRMSPAEVSQMRVSDGEAGID